MNKTLRYLLILAVLVIVLIAAGSQSVWATPAAKQPEAAPAGANSAPAASVLLAGSVQPRNCDGVNVVDTNVESVCGVAIVSGASVGTQVFASLNGRSDNFYSQTVTLYFSSGSAQICFAAPKGGTIYFRAVNTDTWEPQGTDLVNGEACFTASLSGDYALGHNPQP